MSFARALREARNEAGFVAGGAVIKEILDKIAARENQVVLIDFC